MRARTQPASAKHEAFYQDVVALVRKHASDLPAIEMLAIAANLVGKMIAMQDQRITSPAVAMEVVAKNIESGNQEMLEQVSNTVGRA